MRQRIEEFLQFGGSILDLALFPGRRMREGDIWQQNGGGQHSSFEMSHCDIDLDDMTLRAPGPRTKPAPLHRLADDVLPPGCHAFRVRTEDGQRLRAAAWPVSAARGSLLVFPGRTEFLEMYHETARSAQALGLSMAAIEWRNQGLNERPLPDPGRGHVGDFREYQLDAAAFLAAAAAAGLPRPWYLLGFSMGGTIALRWLAGGDSRLAGLVLLAPMFRLLPGGPSSIAANALSNLACRLGCGGRLPPGAVSRSLFRQSFRGNPLTRDPVRFGRVGRYLALEPQLTLGGPTWGWLAAALRETNRLRQLPAPDLPTLVLLAQRDRIVRNGAVRKAFADLPSARIATLRGSLHCPLLETDAVRQQAFDEIQAWVMQVSATLADGRQGRQAG